MSSYPVTLDASIRANLLSLQNTTKLLDITSNRLSTGKKVNSALDNANSFYTAQSLTNNALDLSDRKDGIGQGISLLEATDKSLSAITALVEQAQAKAQQAEEKATGGITALQSKEVTAVTGTTILSTNFSTAAANTAVTWTALGGTAGDGLTFAIEGETAIDLTIGVAIPADGASTGGMGTTIGDLISALNTNAVFKKHAEAKFNSTTNQIDITAGGGAQIVITTITAGMTDLGGFKKDGAAIASADVTTFATQNTVKDSALDVLGLTNGNTLITTVTGGGTATYTVDTQDTIAEVIAGIESADSGLTATFNTGIGKLEVKAANGTVAAFSGTDFSAFTWATNEAAPTTLTSGVTATYSKAGSEVEVGGLTTDFRTLLKQINGLVSDATYKGNNLLKGQETVDVKFNIDGTSKLSILGKQLETDDDGILKNMKFTQKADDYNFTVTGDITSALNDAKAAILELRTIGATFGSNLGIVQTRQDFTNDMVNTLEAGSGKLVNADLETESAKLLALQTRQALGIQSLSIANTSQQSILALFR
jgi:flagellin-like hook-associated protein FlgL